MLLSSLPTPGKAVESLDISKMIHGPRIGPEGTHLYTCGPSGLMDAAISAAEALGWPPETIHVERFGAAPKKGDQSFKVVCVSADKIVEVAGRKL